MVPAGGAGTNRETRVTTPLPIQSRPPIRGGLGSVAQPLPMAESEWRGGVLVTPETVGTMFRWGCQTIGEKPLNSVPAAALYQPTSVGIVYECGPGAGQLPLGPIGQQIAVERFRRQRWSEVASLLQDGITDGPEAGNNFSFEDATLAPGFDPAAEGDIAGTLQGLLDTVCSCFGTDPVFHVPRPYMAQMLKTDLVVWDEASETFRFGPHMVSFDCYSNIGPAAVEGGANPTLTDGSEFWIWASSQPMVAWSDGPETVTSIAVRRNENLVRVEQEVIAVIDSGCLYAARARVCS